MSGVVLSLIVVLLIISYEKVILKNKEGKVGRGKSLLVPVVIRIILSIAIIELMSGDIALLGKLTVQSIYILIELIFFIKVRKSELTVKEFLEQRGFVRFFTFYLILMLVFTVSMYTEVFGSEIKSISKLLFALWLAFTINLAIIFIQIGNQEKDEKGVSLIKGLFSFIKATYKTQKTDLLFYYAVTLAGCSLVLNDRVEMIFLGIVANLYSKCYKSSIFQFIIVLLSFYTKSILVIYCCALVIFVWNTILLVIMYRKKEK